MPSPPLDAPTQDRLWPRLPAGPADGSPTVSARPRPRGPLTRAGKAGVRALGTSTAPLRPWPDFLVIGTKRGGTTSLYRSLLAHPQVLPLFPSAARLPMRYDQKGVHYFDTGFHRGAAWYRGHFPTAAARAVAARRSGAPVVVGEASPYYLFHPWAADRAAALLPTTKVIAVLRDPVARTWSHWKERRRERVETLSFADALAAEPLRLAGEEERIRGEAGYRSFAHEHLSYAAQSDYLEPLGRWVAAFGRRRVLVLASEDYYRDPQGVCDRVAGFLGIDPAPLPVHIRWNATDGEPLDATVARRLHERFAPRTALLEAQLDIELPWPTR